MKRADELTAQAAEGYALPGWAGGGANASAGAAACVMDADAVLRVQAAVLAQQGFTKAASVLVNELSILFGATRVCLGWVEQGCVTLVAMSGELDFLHHSELARDIGAAMDEALEQGCSMVYPAAPGARPRILLAHAELARRGSAGLVTVPLAGDGRFLGAVTLEQLAPATQAQAQAAEHLLCQIAPVLALTRAADRPWHSQFALALRSLLARLAGPGHAALKAGALACAAVLTGLCGWPVAYQISAPAHLEGEVQRVLVAPSDGFLRAAHVLPGDPVVAGQVVVELADQDLELDRRKWASEREQYENSTLSALARGERTAYVVNFGKANAARAQLELVERQIARSRVRSPFDGIVIKGDLSQSLGAPVQRGDVLLTIAPAHQFRVNVEVDERDISDVKVGSHGALALAALPDTTLGFSVVRVTPVATAKEGRNFYEVQAQLEAAPATLRPGLLGVAKIAAGQQSLGWIWTHRALDAVRLAFWTMG